MFGIGRAYFHSNVKGGLGVHWMRQWFIRRQKPNVTAQSNTVVLADGREIEIVRSLDCIGASCPRPQLLTMWVLDEVNEGDVIELKSDNPATVETLPALMFSQGGTHVATQKHENYWCIYMRKGIFDNTKKIV